MLKKQANKLIDNLQQNRSKIQNHPDYIYKVVQDYILPVVDQRRMARSIVNQDLWNKASEQERKAFIAQMRELVMKTYASAFQEYNNEQVRFRPLSDSALQQQRVTVQSQVLRSGRSPVPVEYSLIHENGSWKVYDFSVEGVSMVNSFRSLIVGLQKQKLTELTEFLKQHNQQK
jgi:phospholipid transport system substrate-binding protein